MISIYVESGRHEGQPCIILYPNAFERWDDSPPEMKLPACVIINPDAFDRWDGDAPSVKLPSDERERIQQNFIEAMLFQGLTTVVESGVS